MAKKELTVESLAEVVMQEGIAAAKEFLAEQQEAVDAGIAQAQKALADLQQKKSMLDTLLIGAVKMATRKMGIALDAPAAAGEGGAASKGRRTQDQIAANKQAILGVLPKSEPKALKAVEIAEMLNADKTDVAKDLKELIADGAATKVGERTQTRYYAV